MGSQASAASGPSGPSGSALSMDTLNVRVGRNCTVYPMRLQGTLEREALPEGMARVRRLL